MQNVTLFFKQIFHPAHDHISIIIEDDSKVAYAYLLEGENVVSDVWLYNSEPTPEKVNWKDKDQMPFLNPSSYVDESQIQVRIAEESDVVINWPKDIQVNPYEISIRGRKIAMLKYNCFPGWSIMVKCDGPLAKKWDENH